MRPTGLYGKYQVRKLRRSEYFQMDMPQGPTLTDVFVLRPERDPAAFKALACYAAETPSDELAADLWKWLKRIEDGDGT